MERSCRQTCRGKGEEQGFDALGIQQQLLAACLAQLLAPASGILASHTQLPALHSDYVLIPLIEQADDMR